MTTQNQPIELFSNSSPNGRKITIMLEELGVPYVIRYLWFSRRMQYAPEFTVISPNNRIPAIVDPEGPGDAPISVFESGAVLKYLATKFGRFYPADWRAQVKVDEWLFWQVGGFGPAPGQLMHFLHEAPEPVPYAIERYRKETQRLYSVLDRQLEGRDHVAGDYTIADIAIFGWAHRHKRQQIDLGDYPSVERWFGAMMARPAVLRGLEAAEEPEKGPRVSA